MIKMETPKCKTCRFFNNSFCHRFPPTPVCSPSETTNDIVFQSPMVVEDDWCGEYKSIPFDFSDFIEENGVRYYPMKSKVEGTIFVETILNDKD